MQLRADLCKIHNYETVTAQSGLANALVIVADNTVHLAINAAALTWWR
ncbi:hypothetical protein [Streptomyces sp. V1I1]|nr:hypothetical protein [Streptomyces sp. V1I1]MDQ0938639.1 hypothetical protein [Streptomyces sp. V1I1]